MRKWCQECRIWRLCIRPRPELDDPHAVSLTRLFARQPPRLREVRSGRDPPCARALISPCTSPLRQRPAHALAREDGTTGPVVMTTTPESPAFQRLDAEGRLLKPALKGPTHVAGRSGFRGEIAVTFEPPVTLMEAIAAADEGAEVPQALLEATATATTATTTTARRRRRRRRRRRKQEQ